MDGIELAEKLAPWCGRMRLQIVPFTEIQENIRRACPEDYFTIIMRRFMMRIAQRCADEARAKAIVTGDRLLIRRHDVVVNPDLETVNAFEAERGSADPQLTLDL